jgi:DNA modification methylase
VLCGDATKAESFAALLGQERAQMVFTDPPYNVPIDGHVCGLGQVKHREFAMAAGEMSPAEFDPFGGSGSTLIAADRTGRKARLIEIDAHYADTIVRRWQALTGGEAADVASGRTYPRCG